MVKPLLKLLLARRRSRDKGFTLAELLIVTLIAGGIISGLMFLVVELLTADQRESSRSETQRDMQRSLDYMSAELREAIFVYPGECIVGRGTPGSATTRPSPDFCPGLRTYLPPIASNGRTPVVAFWKQKRLPDVLLQRCASNAPPAQVPCLSGHSYALVVYSLSTAGRRQSEADTTNLWSGRARIVRFELAEFNNSGNRNPGYVDPVTQSSFQGWPFQSGTSQQQGTPPDTTAVLTDFVDDGTGARAGSVDGEAVCPDAGYSLSPPNNFTPAPPRSFYACIRPPSNGANQEVLLFVRGNAVGRSGVNTSNAFLPSLSTRVLARGVLDKQP